MNDVQNTLFGEIHPDAFALFTRESGEYYADLLEYLVDHIFLDAGFTPRQEVIDGIKILSRAKGRSGSDATVQANQTYHRLRETGWLVEQKQGFHRLTDFDPAARMLLDFLLDFKSGRLRSYGSEVIQVLALIESADRNPEERSSALSGAAKSSRSFLNHLRGLAAGMKKAEDAINAHSDFPSLFETFFKNYVERFLIEDYKTIHTKANPFRYRLRIRELAELMLEDDLKIEVLAKGYVREARAPNPDGGRTMVIEDLRKILQVFENIDPYLDIIEETNRRVEVKIRNTVRFLDQIEEANTETLERVIARLGALDADEVDAFHGQFLGDTPVGNMHLFQPPAARAAIKPHEIRAPEKSPARLKYEMDLLAYRERSLINTKKVVAYLEQALGSKTELKGSELPIRTLDDFFVFSHLPSLEYMNAGELRGEWSIEMLPGFIENDWIIRRNFVVKKTQRAGKSS